MEDLLPRPVTWFADDVLLTPSPSVTPSAAPFWTVLHVYGEAQEKGVEGQPDALPFISHTCG